MEKYALITGASRGLGAYFAEELASRQFNLILVSLPNQNLSNICEELEKKYTIKAYPYETNLSIKKNILQLTDWINQTFSISVLINNAGTGGSKRFEEASIPYLDNMIQLNVTAPTLLTHQLLQNLQKQEAAYILNISSLAAFSPIGYKTVYPASKVFIHSFSRGLNQELKDTNIWVSVVNPGPMKTNGEISNRINKQGFFGRVTCLDPKKVAAYCVEQLFKKKKVIKVNFISWLVLKITPTALKISILTKKMKNEIE